MNLEQDEIKIVKSLLVITLVFLMGVAIYDAKYDLKVLKGDYERLEEKVENLSSENRHLVAEKENYRELYKDEVERNDELWTKNSDLMFENFKYELERVEGVNESEKMSLDEIILLAKVCEKEAGVGKEDGIRAVCKIIMNRVASDKFPNTIKDVVYQSGQFEVISNLGNSVNKESIYLVMQTLLCGYNGIDSELYFHAYSGGGKGKVIDGNIFY